MCLVLSKVFVHRAFKAKPRDLELIWNFNTSPGFSAVLLDPEGSFWFQRDLRTTKPLR